MRKFVDSQTGILLRRFASQVSRTAKEDDAEAIHNLRVAIRRLRRCLQVFSGFYPGRSWKKIRRRLADLMDAAGEVRDRDIALELLAAAGISSRSAVVRQLEGERRQAGRMLQLELGRWKERDLARKWRAELEVKSMKKAGTVKWNPRAGAAANARRELPRLVAEYFAWVRELVAEDPAPPKLHQARLAGKRLRYTLELFRPCYGSALEQRLDTLKKLQQVLGEVNDTAAAGGLLRKALKPKPAESARVQRFLEARAIEKTAEFRAQWTKEFDAPGREEWWTLYLARSAR
jgi:CHAD domain-containing protein